MFICYVKSIIMICAQIAFRQEKSPTKIESGIGLNSTENMDSLQDKMKSSTRYDVADVSMRTIRQYFDSINLFDVVMQPCSDSNLGTYERCTN